MGRRFRWVSHRNRRLELEMPIENINIEHHPSFDCTIIAT